MYEYIQIIIGAAIGFGSAVATNWIANRWRLKEEKEKNRMNVTKQNIDDSLKYIFKINDLINGILVNRQTYRLAKKAFPDKASNFEKKIFLEMDKKQKEGLQAELMFVSYKLKQIGNGIVYAKFEEIVNLQQGVIDSLLTDNEKTYMDIELIYKTKLKEFVNECIKICKV